MSFDHTTSAGYLLNYLARLFHEELRKRIEPLEIVPGQFPALLLLWQNDGQTQKELVDKLDLEQATMANTLSRMERDGLIVRKVHPTDGRAKIICLSEKAQAIQQEAYKAASEVNDVALADFSEDERARFLQYLQRIIATLKDH